MENKNLPRNTSLKPLATNLRNNSTKEEKILWYEYLRTHPLRFNRQRIIGDYIVDFYCAKAKLVIEIDGSQHYYESEMQKDTERTNFLKGLGLKVIRFSNDDINKNLEGVCLQIDETIKNRI